MSASEIACILLILMSLVTSVNCVQWKQEQQSLPRENREQAIAYYNETITIIGGDRFCGFRCSNKRSMVQFDVRSKTIITDYQNFTQITADITCGGQGWVQNGTLLYIIPETGDRFAIYDLETNSMTLGPTFAQNVKWGACLVMTDEYLWVIGGHTGDTTDGKELDITQIYDNNQKYWLSQTPSLNEKRTVMACVYHPMSQSVYVLGGFRDGSVPIASIETISVNHMDNIGTAPWILYPDILKFESNYGRYGLRAVLYGNDAIIIIGGSNGGQYYQQNLLYNTTANTIENSYLMTAQISSTAAVMTANYTIYTFGGGTLIQSIALGPPTSTNPTVSTTDIPTVLPTATPTKGPTDNPTQVPTTSEPTNNASIYPTVIPSSTPTLTQLITQIEPTDEYEFTLYTITISADSIDLDATNVQDIVTFSLGITYDDVTSTKNKDGSITLEVRISNDFSVDTDTIKQNISEGLSAEYGDEVNIEVEVKKNDTTNVSVLWLSDELLTGVSNFVLIIVIFVFSLIICIMAICLVKRSRIRKKAQTDVETLKLPVANTIEIQSTHTPNSPQREMDDRNDSPSENHNGTDEGTDKDSEQLHDNNIDNEYVHRNTTAGVKYLDRIQSISTVDKEEGIKDNNNGSEDEDLYFTKDQQITVGTNGNENDNGENEIEEMYDNESVNTKGQTNGGDGGGGGEALIEAKNEEIRKLKAEINKLKVIGNDNTRIKCNECSQAKSQMDGKLDEDGEWYCNECWSSY